MSELRSVMALSHVGKCPDPGKAPEVVWLTIGQLVINDEYQRSISPASEKGIRRMAKFWDWDRYQPISVARTGDENIYEVTDGQRRAIAAASNGNIHVLPCYLVGAETLAERAKSFVGINQGRIALTTANMYKGLLIAGEPHALDVQAVLQANDAKILDLPPAKGIYRPGETMAVGTLLAMAKAGGRERLNRVFSICMAAECVPVSAKMLKAVEIALPRDEGKAQDAAAVALTKVIKGQGSARLEMIANSRTPAGRRDYETLADMLAEMGKLPDKRMGRRAAGSGRGPSRLGLRKA